MNSFSSLAHNIATGKKYAPGLNYRTHTNNSGTFQYKSGATPTNCLNFFLNAGNPLFTGKVNTINANFATFQGGTNTVTTGLGIYFSGYFYAPVSGSYTFTLGINATTPNDDISTLWIGTANTLLTKFIATATETNYSFFVYNTSKTTTYAITLSAGGYYPIIFTWGQSNAAEALYLGITPPGGTLTFAGANYFFSD